MSYKFSITESDFSNAHRPADGESPTKNKQKEEILRDIKKVIDINSKSALDIAGENAFKYEFLELDDTTDEEIEKSVTDRVNADRTKSQQKLVADNASAKSALTEYAKEQKGEYERDKEEIASAYEGAKQNANNDSIKRGIARSSIIASLLKDYDLQKLSAINERGENYKRAVEKIDSEIAELDKKLKQSLDNLDMESAITINDEIQSLKTKRDTANQRAIKYNNEVEEKLIQNKMDYLGTKEGKKKYEESERTKAELKDKILLNLLNYYDSISKQEAVSDFEGYDYHSVLDENQIRIIESFLNQHK